MPTLSYQEKSLYGTLAAQLIVYIPYFVFIAGHASLGRIVQTIVFLTLVQIALQAIIAISSRSRLTDERDRLVELYGYRAGYFALVGGVLIALILAWPDALFGFIDPSHAPIHFINVLFAVVALAEIVKVITQLIVYRRDA